MRRREFIGTASGLLIPAMAGQIVRAQARLGGGAKLSGGGKMGGVGGGGGGATLLLNQNFAGGIYDNGEVWSDSGAGINTGYTPALNGSHSCNMVSTTSAKQIISPSFANTADCWMYFMFRVNTAMGPAGSALFSLRSSAPADVLTLVIRSGNTLRLTCGSVNGDETIGTITHSTTYHFWIHYVKGSGANATYSVGFSTNGVKPTSGSNFTTKSNGDATADIASVRFFADSVGGSGWDQVLDRILVDDATIGDNP